MDESLELRMEQPQKMDSTMMRLDKVSQQRSCNLHTTWEAPRMGFFPQGRHSVLLPGVEPDISLRVVRTRLFQEEPLPACLDINKNISHLCLSPVPVRSLGREKRSSCLHSKSAKRKFPYAMGMCPQSVLFLPGAALR